MGNEHMGAVRQIKKGACWLQKVQAPFFHNVRKARPCGKEPDSSKKYRLLFFTMSARRGLAGEEPVGSKKYRLLFFTMSARRGLAGKEPVGSLIRDSSVS